MVSTGCQWRMLPKDFPPFTTVQNYFYAWRDMGVLRAINNTLVMAVREQEGREASPTAGVIDSQSVKTSESGGIRSFDAGKKINGRKRHIVVDTLGLLVGVVVHAADIEDRDGAPAVLKSIITRWPWLRHIFADGGYAGPKLRGALRRVGKFTLEIVKRTDKAKGFEVLPRRCWGGRPASGIEMCQSESLTISNEGAVRGRDYPYWHGYVKARLSIAWRQRRRATDTAQEDAPQGDVGLLCALPTYRDCDRSLRCFVSLGPVADGART